MSEIVQVGNVGGQLVMAPPCRPNLLHFAGGAGDIEFHGVVDPNRPPNAGLPHCRAPQGWDGVTGGKGQISPVE